MADRVGQQVGHYHLQALLGEGGYAQVYLGEHRYLKTQAAIKMLSQRLDLPAQEAFLEEAQTIARLIHPHIVRVLDFGIDQGTPFLVMDYAPHGSLRQRYPLGLPLPLPDMLPLVQQAAQAIQYAHAARRIHRDIKPENLLVGPKQEVWLSDFGLAVLDESDHASAPAIAGTLAYVAPEQLRGKPVPASDQYALGVLVYEWLSGDVPFAGDWLEVASQHLLAAPPPLRNKLPALPPAVEEVVLTALAKDPQKRFPSVEAFAAALTHASEEAWLSYLGPRDLLPLLPAETPDQAKLGRPCLLDAGGTPAENAHPLHTEQDEAGTAPPTPRPTEASLSAPASADQSSQEPSGHAPLAWGSGLVTFRPALPVTQRHKTPERLVVLLSLLSVLGLGYGLFSLGWVKPTQPVTQGQTAHATFPPLPTAWATVTLAATSTPTTIPTATPPAPTATSVPPLTTRFGVAPTSLGDQCSSSQTKLPQKTLILDNTKGTLPVTWQGMISQKDPSNELWATFNPNNGMVPAGQKVTIILKPADHVCMNASSSTTYYASIIYQEDQRAKVTTITDLVMGP